MIGELLSEECVWVYVWPLARCLLSALQETVHATLPHMFGGDMVSFIPPTIPLFCRITEEGRVLKMLAGMTQLPRSESHTHLAGLGQLPCSR